MENNNNKKPLFDEIFKIMHVFDSALPNSISEKFFSRKTEQEKSEQKIIKDSHTLNLNLSETNLQTKLIKILNQQKIYYVKDFLNYNITDLIKNNEIQVSVNMFDEILDFLIQNNIEFKGKNNLYTRLNKFEISQSLKLFLYKLNYFYLDNLANIDLTIFMEDNSCRPSLIEELINILIQNKIHFKQENNEYNLIKQYNLSPNAKSVLYRNQIFYKEELENVNLDILFSTYNCGYSSISEIILFLDIYHIKYKQKKMYQYRLLDMDIDNSLKTILYKNNFYYYEDFKLIKPQDINSLIGITPQITNYILDIAIKDSFINFTKYKNQTRINEIQISDNAMHALYKAGVYFTSDKINLVEIITINPNVSPKTILEIKRLLNNKSEEDNIDLNKNQRKQIRIPWDKYQIALLIYTFLQIEQNKISYSKGKQWLSHVLRTQAIKSGQYIDDIYRNENGIGMCLQHIEYLYSDGQKGLKNFSKAEKTFCRIQREHPIFFNKILFKAKEIYGINNEDLPQIQDQNQVKDEKNNGNVIIDNNKQEKNNENRNKNYICFDKKPTIREIIKRIVDIDSGLINNDRAFCRVFDKIALTNQYTEDTLPSYWSIGRELFRYKNEFNISVPNIHQIYQIKTDIVNLDLYNIKLNKSNIKLTTAKIIEIIWSCYPLAFENDRLLVKIFDSIAIKQGYAVDTLPKYWNIIRASFEYKKNKIAQNNAVYIKEITPSLEDFNYDVLQMPINQLNVGKNTIKRLLSLEIKTIKDLLTAMDNNDLPYIKRKTNDFYVILKQYGIEKGKTYIIPNDESQKCNETNTNISTNTNDYNKISHNIDIDASKSLSICNKYIDDFINIIKTELMSMKKIYALVLIKQFNIADNNQIPIGKLGRDYGLTKFKIQRLENKSLSVLIGHIQSKINIINKELDDSTKGSQCCIFFEYKDIYDKYQNIINKIIKTLKLNISINWQLKQIILNKQEKMLHKDINNCEKRIIQNSVEIKPSINKLKELLVKDFYWNDELIAIYQSLDSDIDITKINFKELEKIGFSAISDCVYSQKYNSLSEYIQHFLSQDIVNLKENSRLRKLQGFYPCYSAKKNNLELLEFSSNMYISINKLMQSGINKEKLIAYQNNVISFVGDKYFTITYLKGSGFKDIELDKLGFGDYFYASILLASPLIQHKQISNEYLMKVNKKPFDLSDFIIYIMGYLRKIDIYDLCQLLKEKYNLNINKYRIISITKECELYYNQITEKIYIDYDEFYNEI